MTRKRFDSVSAAKTWSGRSGSRSGDRELLSRIFGKDIFGVKEGGAGQTMASRTRQSVGERLVHRCIGAEGTDRTQVADGKVEK